MGKLPGNSERIRVPGKAGNFHRVKVDEEAGYVINTFTNGGLVVSDINDHRILWALDEVFLSYWSTKRSLIVVDGLGIL